MIGEMRKGRMSTGETRKCCVCGKHTPYMYQMAQPIPIFECIERTGPETVSTFAWYCIDCASSMKTTPWAYRYDDASYFGDQGYITLRNDVYVDLVRRAFKNQDTPNVEEPDGPDIENAADMVNDPPHYRSSVPGIESIKCIEASMSKEEFLGFLKGTVMKYIWRYRNKGGVQDLEKAQWFQKMLIEKYKEMLEVRDA